MQKRNNKIKNKRSQITIFVIIAIIIVAIIATIFLVYNKGNINISPVENPQAYMEKCAGDSLEIAELRVLEENGYPNKTNNFILYRGEKIPYLCKSSQFYVACINQEPMFIEKIRKDIYDDMKPEIEKCFSSLLKSIKNKGYDVKEDQMSFDVEFAEDSVSVNINKMISIKKAEDSRTFSSFKAKIQSPLYKLVKTAMQITNYESTLCEFDNINWMMNYPDILITRFVSSDSTKIYTLTDKTTSKKLSFAIKTCVLPAGI